MPHDHADDGHAPHPHRPDQDGPLTEAQITEIALRELLIEKDIFTPAQITAEVAAMDARSPAQGARVVARAWTDPAYKARLLENGTAACEELGIEMGTLKLVALENTDTTHNVVVCTLCSCYPRNLLGLPPDWYKSRAYRSRTVKEPRAVLREFGTHLPEQTHLRVHDSTADMRYLVIPRRPEGTQGLDEGDLAALVTRDGMIGVTRL
jgi:nitrile hydratase